MKADATTFDVIVVGGGGSGLAAAIEARAVGASVLLLEKNPSLGGSTAWSIGSITATGTPHQKRQGIVDDAQQHWADMAQFNGALNHRDNTRLRRILADEMPSTFEWLLRHGIRFFGPMPEPPHSKPRMHNVLPNSRSYITHLERSARASGVVVHTSTRVKSLATDQGKVVGVEYESERGSRTLLAKSGVVLATGDFTSDPELKSRFMGPRKAKIEGVNVTATGDGHKLALGLGGRILNGDLALGPELRFVPPSRGNLLWKLPPWPALASMMGWSLDHLPSAILRPFIMSFVTTALAPSPGLFDAGGLLINKNGQRLTDEKSSLAFEVADQPDKIAYILLDFSLARGFTAWPNFISTAPGVAYAYLEDYRRNRTDIFYSAPTLEALSERLEFPAGALVRTVQAYNEATSNRRKFGAGPYVSLSDPCAPSSFMPKEAWR